MDVRKTIGAARARAAPQEIHADSPDLSPPLSAEQVYHDYAPRVYNMARRMVASDVDAEDVTQDVLLQVVRKLPSFRGESAFPTWLHRVTVNAALTHRRRHAVRHERGLAGTHEAAGEVLAEGGPDDQALYRELCQLIDGAIDSLPSAYRAVFELADVEGLPNAEVAQRLRMSLPAVKSRLHRARGMMRDALAPHFSGG
jgi:RNA polymerase sigma-70 factor (ECF subfamily)